MKVYLFILLLTIVSDLTAQQTFYISTEGNDDWSGRLSNINSAGSDGPFRTFERALQQIATLRSNKSFHDSITIQVKEGTYRLKQSVRMNQQHSGTTAHPTIWKNYKNAVVRLVGGQKIDHLEHITDSSIIKRLPAGSVDSVLQCALSNVGITHTAQIEKRGSPGV